MNATSWHRWDGTALVLRIRVQPRTRDNGIDDPSGDVLRVRLKASPLDGEANRALIDVLAAEFSVPKRRVRIRHGHGSRTKLVRIERPPAIPDLLRDHIRQPGLTYLRKASKT